MKNKLVKELNMFLSIKNHMHKNEIIWGNVKEISKALEKFYKNIEQIQDLPSGSDIDLSDLAYKKDESRKALLKETSPVINILKVHAKDTNDKSSLKKIKSLKKNFCDLKDSKLIDFCKIIFKESKKQYNKAISGGDGNKAKVLESKSILNYGLSGVMIDNLEEEYLNFGNAYMIYTEAKWNKNKIIRKFKSLCKKNQNILKDKIDLLVTIFEAAEPEFCKTYKLLRAGDKKTNRASSNKKTKKPVEKVIKNNTPEEKKETVPAEIKEINETKIVENKKAPIVKKTNTVAATKSKTVKTTGTAKVTKAPAKRKPATPRKKVTTKTSEQKEEIAKS